MIFQKGIAHHIEVVANIVGEFLLCSIALFLTLLSMVFRTVLFIFERAARLLFQLMFTLLLASLFILAYLIIMAIYLASSFSTHLP